MLLAKALLRTMENTSYNHFLQGDDNLVRVVEYNILWSVQLIIEKLLQDYTAYK